MIKKALYKYSAILGLVLLFVTKSHSQSQSLPITSYGVWDRGAGVVDYSNPNSDFIKGIEISANWDEIQPTGLTSFDFSLFQQKLDLTWKSIDTIGTVKIWISTSNNYSVNGKEEYILLSEVPLNQNRAVIDISKYPSNFYKVVLEGKYNTVNKWFKK
jgi:hypothetical protein